MPETRESNPGPDGDGLAAASRGTPTPGDPFTTRLFDRIEALWSHRHTQRGVAIGLVVALASSIGLIELSRLGAVPTLFGHPLPTNHFQAISWTITLLLIVEVLDLVFALARSMSQAMGRQLGVLSLVLLRKTFDELPDFPEPLAVAGHEDALLRMGAQAGGALALFGLLLVYRLLRVSTARGQEPDKLWGFVAFKKAICLGLLALFLIGGGLVGLESLTVDVADDVLPLRFFEWFYTALVFADIALVLGTLGADTSYALTFRNFGLAVVTVGIRLSLSAEAYTNVLLALAAGLFAVGNAWLYRQWQRVPRPDDEEDRSE